MSEPFTDEQVEGAVLAELGRSMLQVVDEQMPEVKDRMLDLAIAYTHNPSSDELEEVVSDLDPLPHLALTRWVFAFYLDSIETGQPFNQPPDGTLAQRCMQEAFECIKENADSVGGEA